MEFLKSSYVSTNSLNKIDWNSEMLLWEKYIGQTSFPFTMMCSQTFKACSPKNNLLLRPYLIKNYDAGTVAFHYLYSIIYTQCPIEE